MFHSVYSAELYAAFMRNYRMTIIIIIIIIIITATNRPLGLDTVNTL